MPKPIELFDTPWKITNLLLSWVAYLPTRLLFSVNGIVWGEQWHFYGMPIVQKHRQSLMHFGSNLQLRSWVRSNPLGPNHPVFLCTWSAGAKLEVGDHFAMTGGTICAAESVTIGRHVAVGANCTIIDTDFHPLDSESRRQYPQQANTAPIFIENDVFIGMNSLVLKGVRIGHNSVIGAGSVVTKDIPPCAVVAGNPARVIREL